MDRIILPSGKTYNAKYAADSVATGNFVAHLYADDLPQIVMDFTGADPIVVENPDVGRFVYTGYSRIIRMREEDGGYVITLAREKEEGT